MRSEDWTARVSTAVASEDFGSMARLASSQARRLPRRERPVQDPGIRAGPLAPLLTAGRALRGAALRTGGTDDRVLRACRADDGAEQNRRHAERAASHPSYVSRRASPR